MEGAARHHERLSTDPRRAGPGLSQSGSADYDRRFVSCFIWPFSDGSEIYILAFFFAALISIAISAILPAAGAWPYYAINADSSHILSVVGASWQPVFYGLRDGTFRLLMADGAEGIITFPSLHAALAVILIAALWPIALLRWVLSLSRQ